MAGGNWTWLLPGRVPTLIDAGVGNPQHLDALEEALGGVPLAQVLVTHGHSDHASGVVAIAERMPATRFLKMPWPEPDSKWAVPWVSIADADTIDAGDTSVTAIHTPGHAPDHLAFWHAATGTLFGGDLAIAGTTVYVPAAPRGDMIAYIDSLERVLTLDPACIFPGHGPVIDDPASLIRRSLAHRRRRESQIVESLRHGDTDPEAIVARLYAHLHEGLVRRARETVVAHLEKLERDGRVRRAGEAWHIMDA